MSIKVSYPKTVRMTDNSIVQTSDSTWKNRLLAVETNSSETDVRNVFIREGFKENIMEFVKKGQIGHGMVKMAKGWQIHIRLFRRDSNIQIDSEIEVSNNYFEHLGHGWIPGLWYCFNIMKRYFDKVKIYDKGSRQYVKQITRMCSLSLKDPKTKTSVLTTVLLSGAAVVGVSLYFWTKKKH